MYGKQNFVGARSLGAEARFRQFRCDGCGVVGQQGWRGRPRRWCSECVKRQTSLARKEYRRRKIAQGFKFPSRKWKPRPQKSKGDCHWCGKKLEGRHRKFCSQECSDKHLARRRSEECRAQWGTITCEECGKECVGHVRGGHPRRFCGRRCQKKAGDRARTSRRRARTSGTSVIESVDPLVVFMRDGWRCQLCGVRTPQKLRGTFKDRAPELDHIVPLAAGGAHDYLNTQCCCRKCNLEKGAVARGQLRLIA